SRGIRRWPWKRLPLVVEDERRARGWHGPAEIHGDLRVLDLPALLRRVVVGVLALRPAGAIIVHRAPELARVLDHHRHAVGVALAQVAAGGVVGPAAAELDDAAGHVLPALPLLAEAVLLELEHGREGERVVRSRDVHVLRRDARLPEHDVLRVVAGDAA